ncbi:MAG: hypothetical protein IKB07_09740 [Lachnospiraceae bacterium]|nr:hypothetical protein [Lachnospiraceae bacterium]
MMEQMPAVLALQDGSKYWEHTFEAFSAKVYIPSSDPITEIVNFGFRTPYLLVFEETKQSMEDAKQFADQSGLTEIAASFGGSVVFIYPTCEGGWDNAPANLFAALISESRISQYYKDGTAIMRDRFTGNWNGYYIRGAVLRTCLYGFGKSADYIATHCLQRIEGDGLYGKGDITPVTCILERLSVVPNPAKDARDIPVISIGNTEAANKALQAGLDHVLVKASADYKEDFYGFCDRFHRMMGNLLPEANLKEMGMVREPAYCMVPTSKDNRGDDKDTAEHAIGYVAYYNKKIMEEGKNVPLLFCFHGGGDSAMCMTSVSGWFRVAAKYNFILISVEHHMNSTATEIQTVLSKLIEKYPVDTEQIYSSGFSMGGCKSWDMFQEYPKVFAGVAPMSATFEVGLNVFGQETGPINRDTVVPTFYVGGEITPLPELPFQAQKCIDRVAYVFDVNGVVTDYPVTLEEKDSWENPIYGIFGDTVCKIADPVRKSTLTLNLFKSKNGCCYTVFGSVDNQGHEVRHHSCENAWKFLSQFRRLPDGSITGGNFDDIRNLYEA